ncbi:unnamed protein product [Enterobius vermicularis]|uniref:Protein-tyrosine-phosphatase n=1 Tax=Enterobius vermicularis TaxID=51028 RepID=A0A0N4VJU0_ENTVE|nr:unnamed protein product [Enterobius vermicularis]
MEEEVLNTFRCLFALTFSSVLAHFSVRPSVPRQLEIGAVTDHSVTLKWKQNASRSQLPILQNTVYIRRLDDGSVRKVILVDNVTTALISGLSSFTQYSFSISAENAAGISDISLPIIQRTLGEALKEPPRITGISNTTDGCIETLWSPPKSPKLTALNYKVTVRYFDSDTKREFHTKENDYTICYLPYNSLFELKIEADNGFGYSPPASATFRTDQSIPDGPPEDVRARALSSSTVELKWAQPERPNGIITSYRIFIRRPDIAEIKSLVIYTKGIFRNRYTYNVTDLEPFKTYSFRVSALTVKGESEQSKEVNAVTDHRVPSIPSITNLSLDCQNTVTVIWKPGESPGQYYHLWLQGPTSKSLNTSTTNANLTNLEVHYGYSVKILAAVNSVITNGTLESYWSKTEMFMLDDRNYGRTINVDEFDAYCQELSRNDNQGFKQHFENIEKDSTLENGYGNGIHQSKDRYLDVCAYEPTRIKIIAAESSDYINANYVDSCEKHNVYIATQAPLPHTFADFWSMIWQEQSNVIVMITNLVEHGRRKCDQYWPSLSNAAQVHGHFMISLISEKTNLHFVHRLFNLKPTKCSMHERQVHQLHFTTWPDHGVPDSVFPLLSFLQYVSEIPTSGPVVVHCSAGIGRSGSYMLIDSMRRHLMQADSLNIDAHLKHIRQQRAKLVQTLEQYIFCHEAVRQLILNGTTHIHVDDFMQYLHYLSHNLVNGRTRLQMQYEDICSCNHTPTCRIGVGYEIFPGFHRDAEFIVATWPHESADLWSLVWEKNCQTIVLLAGDEQFWCKTMTTAGDLRIQRMSNDMIILSNKEDQLCIRTLYVSQSDFELDTWTEISRVQHRRLQYHDSPLMVLNPSCSSNAYMLCLLTSVACQIEAESSLDILLFLTAYKQKLCGVWQTKVKYSFTTIFL